MTIEKKTTGEEGSAPDSRSEPEQDSTMGTREEGITDSPATFKVHLLDIGAGKGHQYGDCVLCQFGDVSVLIDGGHPTDGELVLGQLQQLLKQPSPVTVSLIVVTHPHDDHIGCLPSLVARGDLKAEWALLTDPQYRWGNEGDTDSDFTSRDSRVRGLAEAVLEHDRTGWEDEALAGFVDSVASLETRYRRMLRDLADGGARVVRHGTDAAEEEALVAAFAGVGLKVFGPTLEQLRECHRLLRGDRRDSLDSLDSAFDSDFTTASGLANAYRNLVDGVTDSVRKNSGAANLQSIVTRFKHKGQRFIFGGDMQFADPQVESQLLLDGVTELRQRIRADAPYAFAKLSHHGSDNGFDQEIMDEYGETALYGICCGDHPGHHPHPEVLELLNKNRNEIDWVRTDRNGLVSITFGSGAPSIKLSRGRKDDNTPPQQQFDSDNSVRFTDSETTPTPLTPAPGVGESADGFNCQFSARVPPNATRLSFILDFDPLRSVAASTGQATVSESSFAADSDSSESSVHEAGDIPPEELTPNSADDVESEPGSAEFRNTDADCGGPWRAAKSLLTLSGQVNERAPRRNKASDGTIGDAAHCQRTSDHNPWVKDGRIGVVTAMDITHDPRGGCDANTIAEAIRASRDRRVKYIIWNRRIANSGSIGRTPAWVWRPYTGRNPHTTHVHVSVKPDKANYDSTDTWAI